MLNTLKFILTFFF